MTRRYRVFISATSDLKVDREEAIKAVRACDCVPCAMEDWSGSDSDLTGKIRHEIMGCDFMVLLVGESHGTHKQEGKSWVQYEYDQARAHGIPVIPLVKVSDLDRRENPKGDEEAQHKFRHELRRTLVTKGYESHEQIAGFLSSSLLGMIRPKEQAAVLETNADLISEVADYLNERRRRGNPEAKALLIQYSAQNARDIIRKLLWNDVETHLYVADPDYKDTSEHQKEWIRQNLKQLPNHVDPLDPNDPAGRRRKVLDYLRIYRYRAPGSLRVVEIDGEFLAVGTFAFMVKRPVEGQDVLDVRGGELPMVLFRREHAGFDMMYRMVKSVIRNWQDHGIVPKEPETLAGF